MLLTPAELQRITGYQRRSNQIAWLQRHGIEPFVSATGEVNVTQDIVEESMRRLSGVEARRAERRGPRPNLTAVR